MKYKLICFDVDGTLIKDQNDKKNYWWKLHEVLDGKEGLDVQKERIQLFKEGKINYKQWVDLDLQGFADKKYTKSDFERVAKLFELTTGAQETLHELNKKGYKLAIISGSLSILIDTLFPEHPFDDVFVNKIYFNEKGTIIRWEDTIFDQGTKHKALYDICKRENIDLAHTVFVGDGENDIDILKEAGLGIAFMPKSNKVKDAADVVIEIPDMREILKHL